jgi:hypothetical protein
MVWKKKEINLIIMYNYIQYFCRCFMKSFNYFLFLKNPIWVVPFFGEGDSSAFRNNKNSYQMWFNTKWVISKISGQKLIWTRFYSILVKIFVFKWNYPNINSWEFGRKFKEIILFDLFVYIDLIAISLTFPTRKQIGLDKEFARKNSLV